METKKDMILAAMSEHRYRTAADIAERSGLSPSLVSSQLSRLYFVGVVDRDTGYPLRYILRAHDLPLDKSLTCGELRTLQALYDQKILSVSDHVSGCKTIKSHLWALSAKGAAQRVAPGVYQPTAKGRAFIESLDKPTPKQQPLPAPTPAPTPTPTPTPTPKQTPEPERDSVPWPIPIQPPTVVERPQYTSAALIVAAAAIIIAIIVTGCIQ